MHSPTPLLPIFNLELALKRSNQSHKLASELYGMMLKELIDYRQIIANYTTDQPYEHFRHQYHKLIGANRYCGFERLEEVVNRAEPFLIRQQFDQFLNLRAEVLATIDATLEAPFPF